MLYSSSSDWSEPYDFAQVSARGRGHHRKTVKIQEVSPQWNVTQVHKANGTQTLKSCCNNPANFTNLMSTICRIIKTKLFLDFVSQYKSKMPDAFWRRRAKGEAKCWSASASLSQLCKEPQL